MHKWFNNLSSFLGEIKKEPFDLSTLKSKMEGLGSSKGQCSHGEGEECRDYLLEYPLLQRRCVAALEKQDEARLKIEAQFRAEVQELEKKYMAQYMPLYAERAALIKGEQEPRPEDYAGIPEEPIKEIDEKGQEVHHGEGIKGLPQFWLTALQNHPAISEMIFEGDAPALAALEDIKVGYLESGPGFRLDFIFGENGFFTNRILSKEYHLASSTSPLDSDYIYDHAVGSEVAWKENRNLCFKTVTKTQRQRNGKGSRIVKRDEPQESFFHFFQPPTVPEDIEDSEDEEDAEELQQELEADYQMGDLIKSEIVPNAIHWFTGKALDYADYEDYFEGEEGSDEEDSEEEDSGEDSEDDSEDDSEEEPAAKPVRKAGGKGPAPADQQQCKQQ